MPTDHHPRHATFGQWVNLFVPGGGLIALGSAWTGALLGLVFIACLNLALAATLIFPDDVPLRWRRLSILGAALVYIGAQLRYAHVLKARRRQGEHRERHEALRLAREHLAAAQPAEALEALRSLREQADADLLIAVRFAQAHTALGEASAAFAAWRRVERLDDHYLYRGERLEAERRLAHAALERDGE
jgi:uncharacterized membrane protein